MIHSRPGFAPRTSDDAPAKLNADMVPAIHRKREPGAPPVISHLNLDARAEAAHRKLQAAKEAVALAEAQTAAAKIGPDLLVNPAPTEAPAILEPGK
jgi:hypothetical protein